MLEVKKFGDGRFCLKNYSEKGILLSVGEERFNTEKEAQDFLEAIPEKEEIKEKVSKKK
jgi:hypothetical protein